MNRIAAVILAAIALAALHASFFTALPSPISSIDLSLVLIVGLVGAFRFRDAILAAACVGATTDTLSAMPFGTHLMIDIIVTILTILLFTRIFTNHSWPGLLSLNAVAFIILHSMLTLTRLGRAVLGGFSTHAAIGNATLSGALAALALQIAATLIVMLLFTTLRRTFARFFFTRR